MKQRILTISIALAAAGAMFALDLVTKALLFTDDVSLQPSWFAGAVRLTNHRNFGITADLPIPLWIILLLTAAILVFVVIGLIKAAQQKDLRDAAFLGLILGGAMGNLSDRVHLGFVRDWLLFFNTSAINLADVSIITGIAFYFLRKRPKESSTGS